jgi:hypothetical protein
LTNKIYDNYESASIDMMDAQLQSLLAITWQHRKNDGVTRLLELAKLAQEKVAECTTIFKTDRDQEYAVMRTLDALQHAFRRPGTQRAAYFLNDWAITPSGLDLPRLHCETKAPFQVVTALVKEAKRDLEARAIRGKVQEQLRRSIRAIGEAEQFPFHVPTLAECIVGLASRPGRVVEAELTADVARYEKEAERIALDTQHIKMMEIAAELLPIAQSIYIQIDQCYPWSEIATSAAKMTSLKTLKMYTHLNYHGLANDARFSHHHVKIPIIPAASFRKDMTIWIMRASALMFSGPDRETRTLQRSIVDAERADVQIYGKRLLDSLVMIVPLDDETHDIERQLALLLIRLDAVWRRRGFDVKASAKFLEKLPVSLRDLVVNHGMRRKVVRSKKSLLFCLAGLVAENVYRFRDQHEALLPKGIKTRTEIDDYVSVLVKEHGFQYTAETLRRKRSQWCREFLDRVPEIFGLEDT